MPAFGKLVRFKTASGQTFYGEAKHLPAIDHDALIVAEIPVFNSNDEPWTENFRLSGATEKIAEVNTPQAALLLRNAADRSYADARI
jgi:hypothetical protein